MGFSDGVISDAADIFGSGGEFSEAVGYRSVRDGVEGPIVDVYAIVADADPLGLSGDSVAGALEIQVLKSAVPTVNEGEDLVVRNGRTRRVKEILAEDAATWRLHLAAI